MFIFNTLSTASKIYSSLSEVEVLANGLNEAQVQPWILHAHYYMLSKPTDNILLPKHFEYYHDERF